MSTTPQHSARQHQKGPLQGKAQVISWALSACHVPSDTVNPEYCFTQLRYTSTAQLVACQSIKRLRRVLCRVYTRRASPAHAVMAQHDRVGIGIELILKRWRPLLLPV